MKNSKIEWTTHTFNPWIGCTKVSPGCLHCYAESLNQRWKRGQNWGKGAPRQRTAVAYWRQPLAWDLEAAKALNDWEGHNMLHGGHAHYPKPERPRVFCASLSDWLDDEVPIAWLAELMQLIRRTPFLDWLLLTKRPENFMDRISGAARLLNLADGQTGTIDTETADMIEGWIHDQPPANVWVGTSVEDQARADLRVPQLLAIPARVRFLSCEPLLGPVNLVAHVEKRGDHYKTITGTGWLDHDKLQWVICGGESGPSCRPMHPGWARSLRDQCSAAGTAYLFKQWGEFAPWARGMDVGDLTQEFVMADGSKYFPGNMASDLATMIRLGKHEAGRLLDGVEHNGYPVPA
jgi:protein gp37